MRPMLWRLLLMVLPLACIAGCSGDDTSAATTHVPAAEPLLEDPLAADPPSVANAETAEVQESPAVSPEDSPQESAEEVEADVDGAEVELNAAPEAVPGKAEPNDAEVDIPTASEPEESEPPAAAVAEAPSTDEDSVDATAEQADTCPLLTRVVITNFASLDH